MSRVSAVFLALAALAAAPAGAPLRVKASPAVAPCVSAAALEYARASGGATVETAAIGSPESVAGADVVVAGDAELNRVIESGMTRDDQEVDVATIPWVLAGPAGAAAPALESARAAKLVDVLGGVVSRETWRLLAKQGIAPARSERASRENGREPRDAARLVALEPGEAAVVPLSLAGSAPVTALDVPPLRARALGVRASARPQAARAFLDFLAGERGSAAFRACGRGETR